MQLNFAASHSVLITVPDASVPIQHYLRQPRRLVYALTDRSRVERLADDCFRLTMRPREFLAMSFQPVVDLKVWAEPNGTVHLQSVGCEIRGIEYINNRFDLKLNGKLYPLATDGPAQLMGKGDVSVSVELPPLFWMTPQPILEAAGQRILQGIFLTFKQRLGHQLVEDYLRWAGTSQTSETDTVRNLSANPSTF
ncbi:DUF1997 domain-containing protein [Acaryochloris marina]|uniref:DUF1997 domain-containing protein n=1 Tax=Acaryochloris marina TaxID=155978 RepID=UPI001BAF3693|nr:DUF1997 domain-containing protein [Acaryochloris marina]QUY41643.1 DUF1997 domain-containing protein [Acaryochloris marina S15]